LPQVINTAPRRLGAVALAAAFAVGACSGSASPSPVASTAPGASTAASLVVGGPAAPSGDVSLAGAGATFPGPLYQVWVEKYGAVHPNVKIDY
jgi:phosphate transport system substrate-binding protein